MSAHRGTSPDDSDAPLRGLAHRIRAGDIAAFERLFRAFHAPLCEVVDAYVRSQDVAEDVVQDLFTTLWISRERLDWTESPRGYLFAAARNRALHYLRHRALVAQKSAGVEVEPRVSGLGPAPAPPDVSAEASEVGRAIERAIDALPPRMRLAAVLRWQHDMAHKDVAIAMGISSKGVERLIALARGRLRQVLAPHVDRAIGPD